MKTQTSTEITPVQSTERELLKYTFLKVDSEWRRQGDQDRSASKQEFASIVASFTERHILK